jgi:hypothetical protein
VRWPPAWQLVNWSKSSVVRWSLDGKDVSTEAEESPLLRTVNRETTSKIRVRRLSVCCSDL